MSPKKIKKLADKKYRTETGLFMVEGDKNIRELLASELIVESVLGTTPFLESIEPLIWSYENRMKPHRVERSYTEIETLEHAGTLISNDAGIAVVRQKEATNIEHVLEYASQDIVVALDDIRDPGNLGTIMRIADWYGVTNIVASPTTTDEYNPKVVSATMGSFTRVTVCYTPLEDFLEKAHAQNIPIIAAVMHGTSTHEAPLPHHGILLMGSESHGVSDDMLAYASARVTIPRFGNAESLNVSVATGILLDTMRRLA